MRPRNTISISGPPGSGTSTVAKLLARIHGMEYINSGDIFRQLAEEKEMTVHEFGSYAKEHEEVDREIDMRQVEIARSSAVVLEGRLSGFMLFREKVPSFRIWIDADAEIRAKRVLKREGGDVAQKVTENEERDQCDRDRYQRIYGADYSDPKAYSLRIDSSHIVPELIVERIIDHVEKETRKEGRTVLNRDLSPPQHGRRPDERSLDELIGSGIIILDKPLGPSSHQVSAWAKDVLHIEKAGHGGTLDPQVSGVLVVALGEATKTVKSMLEAGKEYICIMRLRKKQPEQKIRDVCAEFTGEIYQTPPLESAVKRQLRRRMIYTLEVLEIKNRDVLMRVECQAGTYIRTLCTDMGTVLGCGAHMASLRRTRSGYFTEHQAVTLHDLKDAYVFWKENGEEHHLRSMIRPVEAMIDHMPKIVVKDSAVDAVCHGASLAIPGILELDSGIKKGDKLVIETRRGEAVAIGQAQTSAQEAGNRKDGVMASPVRVIMQPGVYPKGWKTTNTE